MPPTRGFTWTIASAASRPWSGSWTRWEALPSALEALGQQLSQVHHPEPAAAGMRRPAQVQDASGIVRDQDLRPGAVHVLQLPIDDAPSHLRRVEGGGAPEAAADTGLGQLAELQPADLRQQPARAAVGVQDVEGLAEGVIGDAVRRGGHSERTWAKARHLVQEGSQV